MPDFERDFVRQDASQLTVELFLILRGQVIPQLAHLDPDGERMHA